MTAIKSKKDKRSKKIKNNSIWENSISGKMNMKMMRIMEKKIMMMIFKIIKCRIKMMMMKRKNKNNDIVLLIYINIIC